MEGRVVEGSRPLSPVALCCVSQCKNLNVIPGSVEVAGKCLVWSWLSKAPSVTGWQMGAGVKVAQGDQKEGLPQ